MVSKAIDKSKNTAKVGLLFVDALSLAFAMYFNR